MVFFFVPLEKYLKMQKTLLWKRFPYMKLLFLIKAVKDFICRPNFVYKTLGTVIPEIFQISYVKKKQNLSRETRCNWFIIRKLSGSFLKTEKKFTLLAPIPFLYFLLHKHHAPTLNSAIYLRNFLLLNFCIFEKP